MIRRALQRLVREEDGITLVIAIAAMAILAITTTGVIISSTTNEDTANRSLQQRAAFAVAQQALAYGEGMVYGDIQGSPSTVPPTSAQNLPSQPGGATGTFTACYWDGAACTGTAQTTWHIVATGTVGAVTRTVSANVSPTQTVTTSTSTDIWSYGVYENDPVGSLTNCTVTGGTVIAIPIFAKGDFCMTNSASKILNTLEVGGKLFTSGGASIGLASSPVPKLRVVNGCDVNNGSTYVTAGTGSCDGAHNSTYATAASAVLDTIPVYPTPDFAGAYAAQAALSKSANCTSSGGVCCPPNLFDNNTVKDNSDSSIGSAMFPSYSYQCTVGTYTLNWTPSGSGPSTLAANGMFYFDGSLSSNKNIQYSGKASFYFTGGVSWSNSAGRFCAVTNCGSSWGSSASDPLIVLVTQCTGISLSSYCVDLTGGGKYQLYVFTTGNYEVSGSGTNPGHVICWDAIVSGGSQVVSNSASLPIGTPVSTGTSVITGTPPTGWSG